jgi:hypothetical protein
MLGVSNICFYKFQVDISTGFMLIIIIIIIIIIMKGKVPVLN